MSESKGGGKPRPINNLKKADEYKLMGWLDTRRDYIRLNRLSAQQVAEEVTRVLDVTVTRNNVISCCRALEIKLPRTPYGEAGGTRRQIATLREAVDGLTARLASLESQLDNLTTALGEPPRFPRAV